MVVVVVVVDGLVTCGSGRLAGVGDGGGADVAVVTDGDDGLDHERMWRGLKCLLLVYFQFV